MENYETHHCNDNFTFSLITVTSQMNDKVFATSQTQLTSCLVSINLSLMSRTLSAPRLQLNSASSLIWCKLLTKNLKPSSSIFLLSPRWRYWICFKTCPCWLFHDFTNYNLNCSERKTTKHIIATITSRLASSLLRHRQDYMFLLHHNFNLLHV